MMVVNHDPSAIAMTIYPLTAGLAALAVAPPWAVCLQIGGQHAGVVSGAMNMVGNLGGALCPVVVGVCVDRWNSWETPLLSVTLFYLMAAACWLAIDPERPIEPAVRPAT